MNTVAKHTIASRLQPGDVVGWGGTALTDEKLATVISVEKTYKNRVLVTVQIEDRIVPAPMGGRCVFYVKNSDKASA